MPIRNKHGALHPLMIISECTEGILQKIIPTFGMKVTAVLQDEGDKATK